MSLPPQKVRIVVYTADRETRNTIDEGLRDFGDLDVVHVQAGIREATEDPLGLRTAQILMVDASAEPDPLDALRKLTDVCPPYTAIIIMSGQNDIRLYRKLLDAGASEYLFTPLKVHLVSKCMREWIPQTREARSLRRGKAGLVVGVRGGCGASTIAMRLAHALSTNPQRHVLLTDFDFRYGDLALQCDIPPNEAIFAALSAQPEIDETMLGRAVTSITPDLDLLATLGPIDARGRLTRDTLVTLLDVAMAKYRYVVAELPVSQIFRALPPASACNSLFLVSDARLSSARDVARLRTWLSSQDDAPCMLHILNMAGARNALTLSEFIRAAGSEPDLVLPYSSRVASASLLGLKNNDAFKDLDTRLNGFIAQIALVPPTPPSLLSKIFHFIGSTMQ